MKKLTFIALITTCFPSYSQTPKDIISTEQASEIIHQMSVSSYLASLTDALYDFGLYCLPENTTRAEIELVAMRHISMREDYEFHGAPEALIEHFPCD